MGRVAPGFTPRTTETMLSLPVAANDSDNESGKHKASPDTHDAWKHNVVAVSTPAQVF